MDEAASRGSFGWSNVGGGGLYWLISCLLFLKDNGVVIIVAGIVKKDLTKKTIMNSVPPGDTFFASFPDRIFPISLSSFVQFN